MVVVITSFSPPTEGIKHLQSSTKLMVNGNSVGTGTLYIAESSLSWRNDSSGQGYSFLYPSIGMHGITRDSAQIGQDCLYILLDANLDEMEPNSDEEGDEESNGTELKFIPEDKGQLDAMYQAMTQCQSLHPDYVPSDDDDGDFHDADEEEVYSIAGGDSGFIEGQADSGRSNGYPHEDEMETEGQFEDAED